MKWRRQSLEIRVLECLSIAQGSQIHVQLIVDLKFMGLRLEPNNDAQNDRLSSRTSDAPSPLSRWEPVKGEASAKLIDICCNHCALSEGNIQLHVHGW